MNFHLPGTPGLGSAVVFIGMPLSELQKEKEGAASDPLLDLSRMDDMAQGEVSVRSTLWTSYNKPCLCYFILIMCDQLDTSKYYKIISHEG